MLPWIKHYAKLVFSSLTLIFFIILIMFFLLELAPGDPVQALIGDAPVSAEFRAEMVRNFNLDAPAYVRFLSYIGNVVTGDLGYSYANSEKVLDLILGRLGNTLILTLPSIVLSSLGAIALGSFAARTRSKAKDAGVTFTAVVGFSIPSFWLSLLLILLFSVMLGWLPAQGMSSFSSSGFSLPHLILPLAAMTIGELAFKTRIMRSSMIESLGQDYIDTARSKGLSGGVIVRRHALLNSMLPMVSVIGLSLCYAIAGSVLVERVFGWPGMGLLLYDAIQKSENMIILGVLFVLTITVVVVNFLTDIVYGIVDPRIARRYQLEREA
ncbi:MAG: ABC transporter permease [Microbacteriaceae bacterium]